MKFEKVRGLRSHKKITRTLQYIRVIYLGTGLKGEWIAEIKLSAPRVFSKIHNRVDLGTTKIVKNREWGEIYLVLFDTL